MFGHLTLDEVVKANNEGKEFYIPFSKNGMGIEKVGDSKVSRANTSDFLRNAKARFRKSNPISPNQADYVNWVLYDEITVGQSATWNQLTRLFVLPIGAGGKTKVNTNLEQVSTLPAPQWFNCTGLSIYFQPNAAPIDIDNFLATEYMEFWVSQKVYAEGKLDIFPASGGIFRQDASNLTAGAAAYTVNANNGWPSIHNMYDLRLPAGLPLGKDPNGALVVAEGIIGVTILQSQTFNVQLKADGGGATMAITAATPYAGIGLTVGCRLHGILSRGVQ
jgi:hypothetical protein